MVEFDSAQNHGLVLDLSARVVLITNSKSSFQVVIQHNLFVMHDSYGESLVTWNPELEAGQI
jgi:hypothetical protein